LIAGRDSKQAFMPRMACGLRLHGHADAVPSEECGRISLTAIGEVNGWRGVARIRRCRRCGRSAA
jgi:hypothetical protein